MKSLILLQNNAENMSIYRDINDQFEQIVLIKLISEAYSSCISDIFRDFGSFGDTVQYNK